MKKMSFKRNVSFKLPIINEFYNKESRFDKKLLILNDYI